MKKLSVFVVCLLLVVSILSIQAFAAEGDFTPSVEQPAEPTAPVEPTYPVAEDKSSVEINGEMVPVDQLGELGYKLVITPAEWNAENIETASEELKAAYAAMKETPVAELPFNDGGKALEEQAKQGGFELDKLVPSDFFDVSIVNLENETEVLESGKMTLTIPVPYAAQIRLVLHQLPDGTWQVMKFEVNEDNSITILDGSTGVYVFLTDAGVYEDILAGKYDRTDLFN